MFIYKCKSDMEDSIWISRLSSSILPLLVCLAGEDNGDDPFFKDDPRDNLSVLDLSDPPVSPEKNPRIPEALLTEDKLPDFDAATALSRTNRRCWLTLFEYGG